MPECVRLSCQAGGSPHPQLLRPLALSSPSHAFLLSPWREEASCGPTEELGLPAGAMGRFASQEKWHSLFLLHCELEACYPMMMD